MQSESSVSASWDAAKKCNLCGGTDWKDINQRIGVYCSTCGSMERTRAMKLVLDSLEIPKPGNRVLHFAPEKGLFSTLSSSCGEGYECVDIDPSLYPYARPRRFDLVTDAPRLPSETYDLIVHNHVLEHIPCNLAYVFFHLHRALTPTGKHVFSVPILPGCYEEDLGSLSAQEAVRRFGQDDHVRRFGRDDISFYLGQLVNLNFDYSLYNFCSASDLEACNIPRSLREGLHSSTIFVASKYDYKLA